MNRILSFVFVACLAMLSLGAFAQTNYTKVTSADQIFAGGKYLIVYEEGNLALDGSLSTLDAVSNTKQVTISGSAISVTDNNFYFTLGEVEGGYSVKSASGYFIGNTSDANTIKSSQTEAYLNTITFNPDSVEIVSAGTHLRYNIASGQTRFRYFKSGTYTNQKKIALYIDAASLSTDPAMTVSAPANGSFFFANSVNVNLTVRHFDLGAEGKIKYALDDGAAQYSTTATFTISEIEDGEHNLALELVDMENASLETSVTANVTFTTDADFSTLMTIPAIQGTADENAQNGNVVATQGIVTAKTSFGFYIQSSTEAYSGLYIYSVDNLANVELGDQVVVRGKMAEFNGLTEMSEITNVVVRSSDNEIFEPIELTLGNVSEQYESMLVTITGTHNGTMLGNAWQIANDAEESVYVGVDCFAFTPTAEIEYEVTGVLSFSNKETYNVGWVILPRSAADINENVDGIALRVLSPAEGSTVMADNVEVQFRVYNFVLGTDGKLKYTLNGGEAQYVTSEEPFTVNNLANGSNTLAFELVTMENASLETPVTATVTFEARTNGQLMIRDIQYTTAADGASPYAGQTVTLSGTVTGFKLSQNQVKGYYIQDAEAAWSGIYVYSSSNTPARNDRVTVTGAVSEYYGLTEMTQNSIENHGASTAIAAVPASISEISEQYESVLVSVSGVCTSVVNNDTWTLSDGSDIKIYGLEYTPTEGTSYTVTGIVEWNSYNNANEWELKPRDVNDIVAGAAVPTISITNPANGSIIYEAAVNATVQVFNFEVGTEGNISFSIDEGEAVTGTETSHAFTDLTNGEHTIHASLVSNDQSVIASATSTFTVNLAGPTFTAIRDIQYTTQESGDSPLNNQTVWVKGVVTSNFINTRYSPVKGYSIQDANEAWGGIWVFDSINNPNIGDSVKFQATVTEYYGLTELKNVANFEVFDMGVITPIDITANEAGNEAYEGCYVRVECVRSIGNTMSRGEWECVNESNDTVTFRDSFSDAYTIEANKNYRVSGVVDFGFGKYRVNYQGTSSDYINANCNLAVDEISENSIEVYPNPTTGMLNIANAEGKSIVVINALGQVVAHIDNAAENQTIDLSRLCDGTYFVKIDGNVVKISMIR